MDSSLVPITLNVNDDVYEVNIDPRRTLAEVLREELDLTGIKQMCHEGECGACTVIIDSSPVLSCLTLAVECEGKKITTVEGLADKKTGELHPLQKAFVELSGMQCGVCTPGMLLTSKALLDRNPDPTEDEIREALAGNLCRCGNYKRIVECVLAAAEIMRREPNNV